MMKLRCTDEELDWYMKFGARFGDLIDDREEAGDLGEAARKADELVDEWEERSSFLPPEGRADGALGLYIECMLTRTRRESPELAPVADRCAGLFAREARELRRGQKGLFMGRVAQMYAEHGRPPAIERMLAAVVGPDDVGYILDTIRLDLYYEYRNWSEWLFDSVDREYREFAERLIAGTGRSARGKLKEKLTIRLR